MKILNSIEALEKMGYVPATKHDKETIEEFLYQGFELDIDENNKVWTSPRVCVAEVIKK